MNENCPGKFLLSPDGANYCEINAGYCLLENCYELDITAILSECGKIAKKEIKEKSKPVDERQLPIPESAYEYVGYTLSV